MATTETKHYVYTALSSYRKEGGASWPVNPYSYNIAEIRGYFIRDKTYRCEQPDERGRILVHGFFKVQFSFWADKNRTTKIWKWQKYPGYFSFYFDLIVCQKLLKFTETFITKHNANRSTRATNAV